jgi:hypothetical protein
MQAVILLALVSGASAFLKTELKSKATAESKLSSWEQMQENALQRMGTGLPKTVIRVAWAPLSSSLLEQGSEHAAQEVTIKASECTQCVEEHFEDAAAKINALSGEKYAEACSFCALYAFGGVYAGQDAQVHPKAWESLPTDKISVVKDESVLASPPRKAFWKDAVNKVIDGTWSLSNAIQEAGSEINVLNCDKKATDEACTVSGMANTPSGVGPTILMEVHSTAALSQKYNKVHSGIQSMMATQEDMMGKVRMDLMMAEASGDKMMISIAKEALESMKAMTSAVVEEEDGLKKQLDAKEATNPSALLQTQKSEIERDQDMPVIKNSVKDAVAYLQSGVEKETGEAVLNAARRLMMPVTSLAAFRKDPLYTNPQNSMNTVTHLDEVARKVVLGLSEADSVSSLAQGAAVQALEEAATELYTSEQKGDTNMEAQTTTIVKQLAKFLPQKKPEEKKVVLKAKKAERDTEKDAQQALTAALGAAAKPSMIQKDASHQDVAKMDKAMSELHQDEDDSEKASLESDLAELGGQDKIEEEW